MDTNKCGYCGREMVLIEITINEVKLNSSGEPEKTLQSTTDASKSYYTCKNCGKRVDM